MRALILVGWKAVDGKGLVPENLYCGLDGVELDKAAQAAAETREFAYLGRLTNPSFAAVSVDPTPIVRTTPKFPREEAAKLRNHKGSKAPAHIQKQEDELSEQRKKRLQFDPKGAPDAPAHIQEVEDKTRVGRSVNPLEAAAKAQAKTNGGKVTAGGDASKELDDLAKQAQGGQTTEGAANVLPTANLTPSGQPESQTGSNSEPSAPQTSKEVVPTKNADKAKPGDKGNGKKNK
jgi:hypothetical protein